MKFKDFITSKGYNSESYADLEVAKQAELQSEFLSEVASKLESKATKEELRGIEDKLSNATTKDELKKATEDVEALALKVAGLTEKGGKGGAKRTIKSIISKQVEENKGKEKKDQSLEVVIKADVLFNLATTAASGTFANSDEANVDANILMATAFDMGFAQRLYRDATILNKIQGATPLRIGEALKVLVPYDESGAPLTVTEAATKPVGALKYKMEIKESTKIAITFPISEEFMNRVDYLVNELQTYFALLVTEVLEEKVFDATTGVLSYATSPTITGFSIATPNNYDALNATSAFMKNLKFKPDTIVMNNIDVASMFSDKGTDGHYSLSNGGSIRLIDGESRIMIGSRVFDLIEVTTDLIAVGTFAMIDWSKLKFGLGNLVSKSDPYTYMRQNVVDNLIEAPFAVMEPSNYSGCVLSDTFANVIADITA